MSSLQLLLENETLFRLVAGFFMLEVFVLLTYWFVFRFGVSPGKLLANTASGGCLIAALWVSQSGLPALLLPVLLGLSFVFHIIDIFLRWQWKPQS